MYVESVSPESEGYLRYLASVRHTDVKRLLDSGCSTNAFLVILFRASVRGPNSRLLVVDLLDQLTDSLI